MKILLISGKAQHGKDTLAKIISSHCKITTLKCEILHLADELKKIAKDNYGWNGEKDNYGRSLLQRVGSEYREHNISFWSAITATNIKIHHKDKHIIIIPDVRFKTEIKFMEDVFGKESVFTIRIDREGFNNSLIDIQKNDSSEIDLDDYKFDLRVVNTDLVKLSYESEVIINECI